MIDTVNINSLCDVFDVSKDDTYQTLLRYSNSINTKLMIESSDYNILILEDFYLNILKSINLIESTLTSFEYIKANTKNYVPIKSGCYIYYLFLDGVLEYIGQSTAILQRIHNHKEKGKIFDSVYIEEVLFEDLLLKEKLYIYRDQPNLNKAVLSNKEYLMEILKSTKIPEY